MFRITTWGLIGIIVAATAYWYSKGASFEGRRTAAWTDLGTWGDGGLIPAAGVGAALDGARKAAEKADKEPVNKQAPPAPQTEPAKDAEWEVAKKEPAKPSPPPPAESESVTAKAIDWPIAEAPVKWNNVRIAAQAESEPEAAPAEQEAAASLTAPAIDWPIADAPITWNNVRIAAGADPEPEAAPAADQAPAESVTAPAIEWPIADAPITWDNVRIAAPADPEPEAPAEPAPTVNVTAPAIDWPIADAPVAWNNVRAAAPEAQPDAETDLAAAREREEAEARRKAEEAEQARLAAEAAAKAREEEEARRRAQLTTEQAACEDELRKIYAEGVILFRTSSAQIDTKSAETLDALAKAAKSCAKVRIRVEGHTDDRGSNAANQALSERRAKAVASYLTGAGVDSGMITAYGYGEERPVAPNDTEENRQKNRRILFTVY